MDLVVPHIQFCSYKHFYPESYSTGSAFNSVRVCNMACKSQIFVLPDHIRVIDFRKPNGTWSTKHLGNCVFAVSKYENSGSKGILQRFERLPKGALNGVESSSANGVNTSLNFEESEIHHLHVLIKNGELDEASRFLEYMTNKGNIYALWEVEEALRVLDCMSVSPNGINYDTILRSLCDRCKLKQGMEVLDRQLQIKCYPDVVTYTELIDAACKDSRVGQAMKLLIEMVSKECKPNVVTYNALIKGICNEGNLPSYGYQPDVISYTIVLHSLSSGGRWTDAMKLLASMLCKGCSLNVVTFNTLINFLCQKGLLGKAFNVLEMIQSMSCYLEIMVSRGCYPDIVTYNILLAALCKDRKVDDAVEILKQLSFKGLKPDVITYSIIIDGLLKVGKTDLALELLEEACTKGLKPNLITFTSVVGGISRKGKVHEAIKIFHFLEGIPKEASKLWSELYSKGPVKKSLVEKIKVKM
ncbi:hypothetical protein GLYMA_14G184300v4 [Glycine max]|uniref:Pentacotripeptide-repeat region of PRORP domain-containing protein n=1 Tax=Glycine max TaxID=3847 RepID=A0A368UH58_SOYBN|nr:hypothetical protein GLYMA_14G184300v4 [Glycine max]